MLAEDLRAAHEDVERLEAAIAERVMDEPKHIRNRLARDHEIANFTNQIVRQSERALHIYNQQREQWTKEIQSMTGGGDPFDEFYSQLNGVKDFHKRNPNEPVENLERAYKKPENGGPVQGFAGDIDNMFTGEEAFGRFFDLNMLHEEFLNLPGIRLIRKIVYLQYLDQFDSFSLPAKEHKMTDEYFNYVGSLAEYLESFMRRSRPLENVDKVFAEIMQEFVKQWEKGQVPGWEPQQAPVADSKDSEDSKESEAPKELVYCDACAKNFNNKNTFDAHLTGKKHKKAAEALKNGNGKQPIKPDSAAPMIDFKRLRERAIAEREHRVRSLAAAMQTTRADTRVNVERKFGMTDKERQQEIAALYAEETALANQIGNGEGEDNEEDEEKVYNPLKLPLSWDGKPIPFWLYKLHGLGVEFPCEICGNYVYMGRRAFDKHFSEQRHVYGLKCLGITNMGMFRDITRIEEAEKLRRKLEGEKEKKKEEGEDVVEMEDSTGTVMPFKVWNDLKKQGLL